MVPAAGEINDAGDMDAYLRRVAAIPRLDRTAEHALAVRARSGDRSAREQLITSSLPFVFMRARKFGLHGQRLLDAVQAGTVGLIEAVDRFDPARNVRLSTYAWWWIGDAISRTPPSPEIVSDEVDQAAGWSSSLEIEDLLMDVNANLADIIRLRFGIGADVEPGRSRQEVARQLGLTVSQVRTLETKALSQLRERLAKVGHRASQSES